MNDASSVIRSFVTTSDIQYLANNTKEIKNKDNICIFLINKAPTIRVRKSMAGIL